MNIVIIDNKAATYKEEDKKIEEHKELSDLFYLKFKEHGVYRYCDVKDIFNQFDFFKEKN